MISPYYAVVRSLPNLTSSNKNTIFWITRYWSFTFQRIISTRAHFTISRRSLIGAFPLHRFAFPVRPNSFRNISLIYPLLKCVLLPRNDSKAWNTSGCKLIVNRSIAIFSVSCSKKNVAKVYIIQKQIRNLLRISVLFLVIRFLRITFNTNFSYFIITTKR